jgi:uncharacterized membrane protein (UPF0127 family)
MTRTPEPPEHRPAPAAPNPAPAPVPTGHVTFTAADGRVKTSITVEIAEDERSRTLGLMYRRSLAQRHGMLFVFDDAVERSFWMKNTLLPLDMIFVADNGTIDTIHHSTNPLSEESHPSRGPVRYVVEVNAGFARAHDLRAGDRMAWDRR